MHGQKKGNMVKSVPSTTGGGNATAPHEIKKKKFVIIINYYFYNIIPVHSVNVLHKNKKYPRTI